MLNLKGRALLPLHRTSGSSTPSDHLCQENVTLTETWWKLPQFFTGLGDPDDKMDEAQWREPLEPISRWVTVSPANEMAPTAQGVANTRYA